jgi:hypothetical protein
MTISELAHKGTQPFDPKSGDWLLGFLAATYDMEPHPSYLTDVNWTLNGWDAPVGDNSNNIRTVNNATAALRMRAGTPEAAIAIDHFRRRWSAELLIAPIPGKAFYSLGSQELLSSAYDAIQVSGILGAVLAMYWLGAPDVAALGLRLLRQYAAAWTLAGVIQPDGMASVAAAGMRGTHRAGGERDFQFQRVQRLGKDGATRTAVAIYDTVLQKLPAAQPGGVYRAYDDGIAGMDVPTLAKELAGVRTIAPWYLLCWESAPGDHLHPRVKVSWVPYNVDWNTGCMYWWAYGHLKPSNPPPQYCNYSYDGTAPPIHAYGWPYGIPGGVDQERVRHAAQGLGKGRCELVGKRLTAYDLTDEEAAGRPILTRWVDLPTDPPTWGLTLSPDADPLYAEGSKADPITAASTAPRPPSSPTPPSPSAASTATSAPSPAAPRTTILQGIAHTIISRNFPPSGRFDNQRILQRQLYSELFDGRPTRPLTAIADDIESFGIGVWAPIVAKLRSMS